MEGSFYSGGRLWGWSRKNKSLFVIEFSKSFESVSGGTSMGLKEIFLKFMGQIT